jgi:3-hydroxybutyrate dehydrogenase
MHSGLNGSLAGKAALVTGSTSGIGLAIARRFAQQGASIALHGFGEPELLRALEHELGALCGHPVRHFSADLAHPDQIEALIDDVAANHGRIDILVNNAGIQHVAPLESFPPERWNSILAVNLSAPFHATRLVLPIMRRENWGRIINIASVSGLVAAPFKAGYTAAKHGLVGLTKVTALETAESPITCNAICPGWVLTPIAERQIQDRMAGGALSYEEASAKLLVKQPSGAFVTLDQVAALASYLASEDAGQTRGVAWNIDGGYVAT